MPTPAHYVLRKQGIAHVARHQHHKRNHLIHGKKGQDNYIKDRGFPAHGMSFLYSLGIFILRVMVVGLVGLRFFLFVPINYKFPMAMYCV